MCANKNNKKILIRGFAQSAGSIVLTATTCLSMIVYSSIKIAYMRFTEVPGYAKRAY